jgi:LPXTG-motif cell wall-anchored protein
LGLGLAVGGDNAVSAAEIAQEQNVSVEQVNECLNEFAATASAAAGGGGGGSATASATSSATALPATGGPVPSSALALGAAVLLVSGGLLARRIVR